GPAAERRATMKSGPPLRGGGRAAGSSSTRPGIRAPAAWRAGAPPGGRRGRRPPRPPAGGRWGAGQPGGQGQGVQGTSLGTQRVPQSSLTTFLMRTFLKRSWQGRSQSQSASWWKGQQQGRQKGLHSQRYWTQGFLMGSRTQVYCLGG